MAGGIGSRFWPASRTHLPKQFLDILGIGKSLLRITYERSAEIVGNENVLIVTNKQYRDLVKGELPELPQDNILCEPSRNNTAPCVAYTALHLSAKNENAVFAMVPSDHVILKQKEYAEKINLAFDFASANECIVTLGIAPTRPDTGYGYIETNVGKIDTSSNEVLPVTSFKEKPDVDTAKEYLSQGNYLWNAGIFVWSTKTVIDSFKTNAPQIIETLSQDLSKYATPSEQDYVDRVYPLTDKISVDYALLEKASNVFTIPADIGWSDLGTWNSLYDFLDKDDQQNVVQAEESVLEDIEQCFVRTQSGKILVLKGLKDFIVVDEKDALIIVPKSEEQEIKRLIKQIKNEDYL